MKIKHFAAFVLEETKVCVMLIIRKLKLQGMEIFLEYILHCAGPNFNLFCDESNDIEYCYTVCSKANKTE